LVKERSNDMIFFWYLFDVINPRKNNNCSAVQHVKKRTTRQTARHTANNYEIGILGTTKIIARIIKIVTTAKKLGMIIAQGVTPHIRQGLVNLKKLDKLLVPSIVLPQLKTQSSSFQWAMISKPTFTIFPD
jgi:hypothetical protein